MAMYRCAECGATFDEPNIESWREEMSGDGWAWQTFTEYYCPQCGSQDIAECYGEDADDAEPDQM